MLKVTSDIRQQTGQKYVRNIERTLLLTFENFPVYVVTIPQHVASLHSTCCVIVVNILYHYTRHVVLPSCTGTLYLSVSYLCLLTCLTTTLSML